MSPFCISKLTSHDPLTLHHHSIKINLFGDKLKIAESKMGRTTSLHRYIKNSSACRIASTEHHLNTDRRSQDFQKASQSPQNEVRQKMKIKKRERERILRWGPVPGEGDVKKEKFLHNRDLTHRRDTGEGASETSEGSATTGAQKAEWREFSPESSTIPAGEVYTASRQRVGAGYSGSGFKGRTPGEDQGWLL